MAEEILRMTNITKRFAGITALDRVEFSCNKGEVHILAGENGAGKSTILKILAGIHQADEGEIYFHGKKVTIKSPEHSQKMGIAMVFQELTLVGEMTVAENVYLNQEPVNALGMIDKKKIHEEIEKAMDKYGIHVDPDALVSTLPVAKQQMVEILKILVRDPELIILDEPTSALAKKEVVQLYQIIHNLLDNGKTIIFISHKLNEVKRISDRITVLKAGVTKGTYLTKDVSEEDISNLMVGHEISWEYDKDPVTPGEAVLKVENLKYVDKFKVPKLSGVSLQVRKGEIVGIAENKEEQRK